MGVPGRRVSELDPTTGVIKPKSTWRTFRWFITNLRHAARESVPALESERTGEVVPAADRHNQYGATQFHQGAEVAVHGAVASEHENGIQTLGSGRETHYPFHVRVLLKGLQVAGQGSQPEDGGSTHFGRKSVTEKSFGGTAGRSRGR